MANRRSSGLGARSTIARRSIIVPPVRQSRWATGRDITLALLMAVGLSTVFLSPLRFAQGSPDVSAQPKSQGRILGESIVVPLRIPVSVQLGDQRWKIMTTPKFGTLAETLGQAAGAMKMSFEYTSRGSSIYLQRFMKVANDVTGSWIVSVNGLPLSDLSLRLLEQGDEVGLAWTPQ